MIAWCLAAALLAVAPTSDEKPARDTAWTALNANRDLANAHRGYLLFLDAHPEWAAVEELWWDLSSFLSFGPLAAALDEALESDSDLEMRYDAYWDALERDDGLRQAEEALWRVLLEERGMTHEHAAAILRCRAHPDEAIRFLENPASVAPKNDRLYELRIFLLKYANLKEELLTRFRRLHEQARAYKAVFPWWQAVETAPEPVCADLLAFFGYLQDHPSEIWRYFRRELVLAGDPHARDWIRFWHRRVRRDPVLSGVYPAYLRQLREQPELRKAAFDAWDRAFGPAPAWPPEGAPPPLPPRVRKDESRRAHPTREDVPMPNMPRRPGKPERPEKPGPPPMPDMPKMPAKPAHP